MQNFNAGVNDADADLDADTDANADTNAWASSTPLVNFVQETKGRVNSLRKDHCHKVLITYSNCNFSKTAVSIE